MERTILVNGWDFRECTKKGFFITPLNPSGEYESVGLVKIEVFPKVVKDRKVLNPDEWIRFSTSQGNIWYYEKISMDTLLGIVYNQAIALGADALTQFNPTIEFIKNGDDFIPYWHISGFAIKRK